MTIFSGSPPPPRGSLGIGALEAILWPRFSLPGTVSQRGRAVLAEGINVKKRLAIFPSPAGMSLSKLSLAGNNLIIPSQGEFCIRHPGWGRENS
jgi:hypothetical protein